MRYLLDTCVISELAKLEPDRNVVKWLGDQDEEVCFLSALTLGEVQKGIAKLRHGGRRDSIQRWIDTDLRRRFSGRILPIDDDAALTWGLIQGEAERHGSQVPAIDGLLAATAIAHNLTLVTRNEDDFHPTGVRVLNPWSGEWTR